MSKYYRVGKQTYVKLDVEVKLKKYPTEKQAQDFVTMSNSTINPIIKQLAKCSSKEGKQIGNYF